MPTKAIVVDAFLPSLPFVELGEERRQRLALDRLDLHLAAGTNPPSCCGRSSR
jgi:hypothetical protein